jgi:hypothetical protein
MSLPRHLQLIHPESDLERELLDLPEFHRGMLWGRPRPGHPEGMVLLHVAEVLQNVDRLAPDGPMRETLRLVALCHDSFKYLEEELAGTERHRHHGHLAADFLEAWGLPPITVDLIRWHDEAFYAWRMIRMGMPAEAVDRLAVLYGRLRGDWPLYDAFFRADTLTGDKDPTPLDWVARHVETWSGS